MCRTQLNAVKLSGAVCNALYLQTPVEKELDEDETWRNGKRLNQLYVGPANLVVPDIYELGSRAEQEPGREHSSQMDPQLTGALLQTDDDMHHAQHYLGRTIYLFPYGNRSTDISK